MPFHSKIRQSLQEIRLNAKKVFFQLKLSKKTKPKGDHLSLKQHNPSILKRIGHLISPYSINPEANTEFRRTKEMAVEQILLVSTLGMYIEKYGEYPY